MDRSQKMKVAATLQRCLARTQIAERQGNAAALEALTGTASETREIIANVDNVKGADFGDHVLAKIARSGAEPAGYAKHSAPA